MTTEYSEEDLDKANIDSLLLSLSEKWGYDFRGYAPISLRRRILRIMELERLGSIADLRELLLSDSASMERFLDEITVGVTAMFRDPNFYSALKRIVIPLLRSQPFLRIWDAGCASGEELYSLAILLEEEGLLGKVRIYATDLNHAALEVAAKGKYPLSRIEEYSENYHLSGGKFEFSRYYLIEGEFFTMVPRLTERVVWAQHNLVTDNSFNEFHLIFCRNVLIYFDSPLAERVNQLFYDSLVEGGILVLGLQETLSQTAGEFSYRLLEEREKIYQRIEGQK